LPIAGMWPKVVVGACARKQSIAQAMRVVLLVRLARARMSASRSDVCDAQA